jgi:hypothetical protein
MPVGGNGHDRVRVTEADYCGSARDLMASCRGHANGKSGHGGSLETHCVKARDRRLSRCIPPPLPQLERVRNGSRGGVKGVTPSMASMTLRRTTSRR